MIVTVANHKGGVGKTAVCAHLVFCAAEQGKRVLAIDFDAQGNLTDTLTERDLTLAWPNAAALFERGPAPVATTVATPFLQGNVDLLPATAGLDDVERGPASSRFAAIENIRALSEQYDLVLIDTPPSLGLRFEVALTVSNRVVAPLLPEKYSIDGLVTLVDQVDQVRRHTNPGLEEPRFILNLVNRQANSHRLVMEGLEQIYHLSAGPLYRAIAVVDALTDRRPVWHRPSNSEAAKQWKDACMALLR